ncbi:NAD-dependent epimerase/dehydratase family protein [Candidatus Uabimicrobium amorphum]|uniref:Putative oxidoreductase n=1 Tax=Uabimicrobium amorphum TaxID=2596890 RepID=A0A5S9IR45_UABAM|nr:NAD-dependent epimerase/dehydratase family protein [Candidatus Uabimicrobium amorphum]BBM86364.1 putative oxidoreductase [Candidatus Uabimicrobium amorphum]
MDVKNKCIAITGIGGFIGARMAHRALQNGMRVKGLEICEQKAEQVRQEGVKVIVGDINNPNAVEQLCQQSDVVFHTAAIVKEGGDSALFRKVNVEGSRLVAQKAIENSVRHFIHLSSVMVYGFHYPQNATEDTPMSEQQNPYCQTKIEGEQVVMAFHHQGKLKVTVIRPGDVYGPGSIPWVVRPIQEMRKGILPVPSTGVINHVYVDNLIDFVFLAMEKNLYGEAFNVTDGEATSLLKFFGYYRKMIGKGKLLALSPMSLRFLCHIVEKFYTFIGQTPTVTIDSVNFLNRKNAYSIVKAQQLGYTPKISLDQGMCFIQQWLHDSENKML